MWSSTDGEQLVYCCVVVHALCKGGTHVWPHRRACSLLGIMVDDTPPVCVEERVRDGWLRILDTDYQSDPTTMKLQWKSAIFDFESLISHFEVELVDVASGATISGPVHVAKDTRYAFALLDLAHTQRVQAVVTGYNRAGSLTACATNGVLIDLTPAEPADATFNPVLDGNDAGIGFTGADLEYTTATQAAFATWRDFVDPESSIQYFYVWAESVNGTILSDRVFANYLVRQWTVAIPRLHHGDRYRMVVRVVNGAGAARDFRSNSVQVDTTPPVFTQPVAFTITATTTGLEAHIISDESADVLLSARVEDHDSGIELCRFALGSYPDGSDLSGVITVRAADYGANPEVRTRGGYEVCSRQGECTYIQESTHALYPELSASRLMNGDFPLLNGYTMYAWVACLNGYVRWAVLLGTW